MGYKRIDRILNNRVMIIASVFISVFFISACNIGYENEIYQSSLEEPFSLSSKEKEFVRQLDEFGFKNVDLNILSTKINEQSTLGYEFNMNYFISKERFDSTFNSINNDVDSLIFSFLNDYARDSLIYKYSYLDFDVKITDSIEQYESIVRFLNKTEIEKVSGFKIMKIGEKYVRKNLGNTNI